MKQLLSSAAQKEPKLFPYLAEAKIEFIRPVKDYAPKPPQTVCLFLYDIRENRDLRSNEPSRVNRTGQPTIERPPLRVDCSYLVTAWPTEGASANGKDVDQETARDLVLLEQLLLSEVLQVLARYSVIPSELLQGKLANPEQEYPPPMITARAEGLNNISEFWTAIGSNLRPSLSVKATISMQASEPEAEARPVRERVFHEEDKASGFDIGGKVKDDKGAPVPGARVTIQELGLSATSETDGRFSFSRIPIGKYNMRVNWKAGDVVKRKSVEINVPAAAGAYDVELKG